MNKLQCTLCNKTYTEREGLKRHMLRIHGRKYIPGTNETRVLMELIAEKARLRDLQRNGRVRRREENKKNEIVINAAAGAIFPLVVLTRMKSQEIKQ